MDYSFLLYVAIILLSTKVLGLITRRFKMPQVVGALLAGLILGPAVLNILHEDIFITQVSELGVIVLMFTAGMETDIKELKKSGKASFVIALLGVIVPLAGGFLVAHFFNSPEFSEGATASTLLQNIFIGIILTATSVSISVETLKEMGKLNTRAGNAILGAAVIDDILGIIALTIITSMADSSINIGIVLLKILLFFVFVVVAGILCYFLFKKYMEHYQKDLRRFVIISFVFCLLLSYCAEEFFGVADITGAFIAGVAISNTPRSKYIASRFETLSYTLLSPIFFASIGIKVVLPAMSSTIIIFSILLAIIATITKIIGCGLGAKICKYTNRESIQIGMGMISRGEVALIVATKGAALGLLSNTLLGPVIITVVVTTIISPILLKLVFRSKSGDDDSREESQLAKGYEKVLDYTTTERNS
ncbi:MULTISPECIES: cation:proton antiporter [Clostridiaceae]|uniref:Cation:proton antiporter n=1 Tax=Clostridium facile TaxID=2763035 RepID=A0ABR7IRM0_9CLOT|nr:MULTISPECIES: cation:proton antiporter [Clostridiaceae]MBC5787776.1 cation:proton antiporter [Clostridium facile]